VRSGQARVHLRVVDGAPTIQTIDIDTEACVPGLGQEEFTQYAQETKTGCIISRALGGVEELNLTAALAS
jgi:osmotically inducible protein OsmC